MKRFFIKSGLLISVLLLAVLYGAVTAHQGSSGIHINVPPDPNQGVQPNLELPVHLKTTAQPNGEPVQVQHEQAPDTDTAAADADLFHHAGQTLTDRISGLFETGMTATANVVDHLIDFFL